MNDMTQTNRDGLIYCLIIFIAVLALVISGVIGCSTFQKAVEADKNYLTTCGSVESVKDVKYCVHFRQNEEIVQTVFYNHGLLDSEKVLQVSIFNQDSLKEIVAKTHNTIFVVFSFGRSWLATIYPDRWMMPKEATIEMIKTKIFPELVNKFPLTKPWKMVGHSMGGANAATICSQLPEEFQSCMLVNPMLIACNPFNLFDFSCLSAPIIRGNYPSKKMWDQYGQDAMLTRTTKLPSIYVTACKNDKFKLYEGPKSWATKAVLLGLPVVYEEGLDNCNHQRWRTDSVLRMLAPTDVLLKLDQ